MTAIMISLISISKAQQKLAENVRDKRLSMDLTQESLAERSGVPLATLRKFEQKGVISLESFLKLLMVVGGIEEIIQVLKPSKPNFTSIDEVLKDANMVSRKRGRK
jgi:transcriptional regulator with XRE-family HTH domain